MEKKENQTINAENEQKLRELLKSFKKLEEELSDVLQSKTYVFDENSKPSEVKKNIKDYIKNVQKAKKIFEDYERVAKDIEKLSNKNNISEEKLESIVELRETETDYLKPQNENIKQKGRSSKSYFQEYENEILVNGTEVKSVKKKREKQTREF